MPPGRAFIAVQAPEAHCWYCEPMQLNMPSEVQGPDLAEDEPSPAEPVELPEPEPEPEPEPPPVGERVTDGAGLVVVVAEVAGTVAKSEVVAEAVAAADEEVVESAAVGAVMEPISVPAPADPVADPEFSEAEVADPTGTGLT